MLIIYDKYNLFDMFLQTFIVHFKTVRLDVVSTHCAFGLLINFNAISDLSLVGKWLYGSVARR
jgi:hypothetical protein